MRKIEGFFLPESKWAMVRGCRDKKYKYRTVSLSFTVTSDDAAAALFLPPPSPSLTRICPQCPQHELNNNLHFKAPAAQTWILKLFIVS